MTTALTPEIKQVLEAVHYRPAVSIILPFEPKIASKAELAHSFKMAADKVEREILENFHDELGMLVIQKLKVLIQGLNFNTYKQSIAIYVSPVFEKVLYLDIPVEARIMVDESFEIRDLVYGKKQFHKYLVLLLSAKGSRIYLGESTTFLLIVADKSQSIYPGISEMPEPVANFSDRSERKDIMVHKFLHHMDNTLGIILNAYRLPLFVLGTEKITGHFKKLTKHGHTVIEYVHGNYDEISLPQLKEILEPRITNWKLVMQKDLLNQLEQAAGKKKLAMGMKDVWREAMNRKGRLLLVEKDYMYTAAHGGADELICNAIDPYNKFSYIKDAVDDVIEKVLENGGDVEFVDTGSLKDYQRIALIQYY